LEVALPYFALTVNVDFLLQNSVELRHSRRGYLENYGPFSNKSKQNDLHFATDELSGAAGGCGSHVERTWDDPGIDGQNVCASQSLDFGRVAS
jgi:hypothetical protein